MGGDTAAEEKYCTDLKNFASKIDTACAGGTDAEKVTRTEWMDRNTADFADAAKCKPETCADVVAAAPSTTAFPTSGDTAAEEKYCTDLKNFASKIDTACAEGTVAEKATRKEWMDRNAADFADAAKCKPETCADVVAAAPS